MLDQPGRGRIDLLIFVLACLAGGAATGLAVGLIGALIPPLHLPILAGVLAVLILSVLAALRDLNIIKFWLPENQRQVRSTVRLLPSSVGAAMFGVELGSGVRTYVSGTAPYIAILAVGLLAETFASAILSAGSFGLARGLVSVDRLLHTDTERWDKVVQTSKRHLPIIALPPTVIFACLAAL